MSNNLIRSTNSVARRNVTGRRIANPGVTQLRKDADNKILQHSDKIADALVKGAEEGNASSARLLVDLADSANWTEHSDSVAKVLSLAFDELKKEPQTVQLNVTTNPPKLLKPPPHQLTDGSSGPIDAQTENAEPESVPPAP